MHVDPPMSEELANGFYPRFEAGWRIVETIGRALMGCVIVATMFGLLGGGPVLLWTRTLTGDRVSIEYQPVSRFGTPSSIDITADVASGEAQIDLTLSDAMVTGYGLQTISPQPKLWRAGAGSMRLTFVPQPGATRMLIHVAGMPAAEGPLAMSVQRDDGQPVRFSEFVLP